MIEMEIKAKVRSRKNLEDRLKRMGCVLMQAETQTDTIYESITGSGNETCPVFRIRQCSGNLILTMKLLQNDRNTAKELELSIGDAAAMQEILKVLGFQPTITLVKQRCETEFKGFHLCLDELEGLGTFLEIEKLEKACADEKQIYQSMKEVLSELDIGEPDFIREKYYELIKQKAEFCEAQVPDQPDANF